MRFFDLFYRKNYDCIVVDDTLDGMSRYEEMVRLDDELEEEIEFYGIPGEHVCRTASPEAVMSILIDEIKEKGFEKKDLEIVTNETSWARNVQSFKIKGDKCPDRWFIKAIDIYVSKAV